MSAVAPTAAELRRAGVTWRKYLGDDRASWAVFVDGHPFSTGLYRREVRYDALAAYRHVLKTRGAS